MNLASQWLVTFDQKPNASTRVFCFPYAGGSPSIYYPWSRELDSSIELSVVQLPGRAQRIKQQPYTHWKPLIVALASAIIYHLDKPFIFFGHSMGGLIAYELSRYLQRKGQPLPQALFISGCAAPLTPSLVPPLGNLPDQTFIEQVDHYYGAIPPMLLENKELLQLVLPTLRADFQVCDSYAHTKSTPLSCPIIAMAGTEDQIANQAAVNAWQAFGSDSFELVMYQGGHFFLNHHHINIIKRIKCVTEHIE